MVLSELDFLPPALGRLLGAGAFSDESGAMKVPGPTDFRGALVVVPPALLNEFGGKWLCLLPLRIEVVEADIMSDRIEFLEVFDAVELLRVIGITPDPFRAGIGMAGCVAVFFCSLVEAGGSLDVAFAGGLREGDLPGRGKWFKLGSVPTIVS